MGHHSYEDAKKAVWKGFWLLLVVTLIEVAVSLAGKGYVPGLEFLEDYQAAVFIVGFLIALLSIYKAYFIVYEFMHMGLEVPGLRMTVLMPMLLLVWALIAFFSEGNYWNNSRQNIIDKNNIQVEQPQQAPLPQDTKSVN